MSILLQGDPAWSLMFQNSLNTLQSNMLDAAQELSTGQVSNLARSSPAGLSRLSNIDTMIADTMAFQSAASRTAQTLERVQIRVESMSSTIQSTAETLLSVAGTFDQSQINGMPKTATHILDNTFQKLQTLAPDFMVFATNWPNVLDTDFVLDTARAQLDPASATLQTDIDGFVTDMFQNLTAYDSEIKISQSQSVTLSGQPALDGLRQTIKAAILTDLAATSPNPNDAIRSAGTAMMHAQNLWTLAQSDLGASQQKTEQGLAHLSAQKHAFDLEKTTLLAIDPALKAVELETAQTQLEQLYLITSRLSNLSLVNVL